MQLGKLPRLVLWESGHQTNIEITEPATSWNCAWNFYLKPTFVLEAPEDVAEVASNPSNSGSASGGHMKRRGCCWRQKSDEALGVRGAGKAIDARGIRRCHIARNCQSAIQEVKQGQR